MRNLIAAMAPALLLAAAPVSAKPPREESPAPRDLVAAMSAADPQAEAEAIAAAAAVHPFGTAANPVRVGGPLGERAYLARLRCQDGSAPRIGSRGEGGVGAYGSLVGLYQVDCGAAAPGRADIAFDIYHEGHREDRVPAGFRAEPR